MTGQPEVIDAGQLLGAGESQQLEFKRTLRDPRYAARELATLANSGGGRLIVGVDERGPIGVDDPRSVEDVIRRAGSLLKPAVPLHVKRVISAGKTLVLADIGTSEAGPVVGPDGAIMGRRVSGESYPLDAAELTRALGVAPSTDRLSQVVRLLATLNESNEALRKDLDQERQAATAERTAQAAERAEAAKSRTIGARMTEWLVAGVIGAVLGFGMSLLFG